MDDDEKIEGIKECLIGEFPDYKVETEKDWGKRHFGYFLNMDHKSRMVLKITDDCFFHHPLDSIEEQVKFQCIPKMRSNINKEIFLLKGLSVEIRDGN